MAEKNNNYQVVLLVGGLGSRLNPITKMIPKAMIDVNGKPFLEYQFEYLKKYGFKKYLLLVSFLGEQIENYFQNGQKHGIRIEYSYEKQPMGTGGALKLSTNKLEEKFILINGDTFYSLDYNDFLRKAVSTDKGGMIVVYDNHDKVGTNNIKVEPGNIISNYSKKKNLEFMNGIDGGVSFFTKGVLDLISEGIAVSFEDEIYPILCKQKLLSAYCTSTRYYDMGTFERLELIKKHMSRQFMSK